MKWHLVDGMGAAVRSCEADHLEQAQFRLAPILRGQSVLSDATYRIPVIPPLTDAEAKGVASGVKRGPCADPKKAARQARWDARRRQGEKARDLTGRHRDAIRQANTRRMLTRMQTRNAVA